MCGKNISNSSPKVIFLGSKVISIAGMISPLQISLYVGLLFPQYTLVTHPKNRFCTQNIPPCKVATSIRFVIP
jgi:hypothetical protein